jgi:hypothetical protein
MADKKISQLTAATTPLAGTEVLPIVQSSSTVKVAVSNLTAGRNVSTKNVTAGATLSPWGSGTTGVFEASGGGLNMALYAAASGLGGVTNNFYTVPGTGDFYAADGVATRYYQFNGQHVFQRAATGLKDAAVSMTTVMATDTSNNVTFNTGNLVQGTAAKGVNFTANTPAAGMTSQLLNWYEEGTWTPTLEGGTTAGTYSITTTSALYTKIGRQVTVTARMTVTVTSAGTGGAKFGGLPFAKSSAQFITGSVTTTNVTFGANVISASVNAWTSGSSSDFALAGIRSATSPYDVLVTDIADGAEISVTFTYFV